MHWGAEAGGLPALALPSSGYHPLATQKQQPLLVFFPCTRDREESVDFQETLGRREIR